MKFKKLSVRYSIAFRPHFSDARHHSEHREGTAYASAGTAGKTTQERRCVPRMSVSIRKKPTIEDECPADHGTAWGFALFHALQPAAQDFQNDKRGKVKGDQSR